jgi:hypothetical protein
MYRFGRPNALARVMNRGWAILHGLGIAPNYLVTLEVRGRSSGRTISFPLVMTVLQGKRYLVSMLGEQAAWVRNLRAAGGRARLRHGRTEEVRLVEVPVELRPPVLQAYLKIAPGARPHIGIDAQAPMAEIEAVAGQIPVFLVLVPGGHAP